MREARRGDKAEVLATRMMDLGACKLCGPSAEHSMWSGKPRVIVGRRGEQSDCYRDKLAVVISWLGDG